MFSDSSFTRVGFVKEVDFGVTPPASALQEVRITGESLNKTIETTMSEEIRADRMVPDIAKVDANAEGDLNFELSYGTYDGLSEGLLFSSWSAPVAISGTDIEVTANNKIESTTTSFAALAVGQWIKVSGFVTAANNGFKRVMSVAANEITVMGTALVVEAAGASVAIASGGMIRNSVVKQSYTIEKHFSDVNQYYAFRGMRAGGMELEFAVGSILGGSLSFQGLDGVMAGTSVGIGYTPTTTSNVMNSVDNVAAVIKDDGESTSHFQSIDMSLDNGLRPQKAIGTLGSVGIGAGRMTLTGSLTTYFEDRTWHEIFQNGTPFLLSFRLQDDAGNNLIMTMPKVKITGSDVVAGAIDEDILYELEWTAIRDAITNAMIQFDRFPA